MNQPLQATEKYSIYLIFIAVIIIWGIAWPVAKLGLHFMPPLWYATGRIFLGAITLFIVLAATKKLVFPRAADIPHLLSVGLLLVAAFQVLVTLGLFYVSAGRSTILVYTTQIWVIPIAYFIFKEPVNKYHIFSLILGIIGLVFLFSPLGLDWHDPHVVMGNVLLLLAAMIWAINIVITRYLKWHSTPLQLLPWQLLIGLIPIVICALIFQPNPNISWNSILIGSLLYTGILGTAFAVGGMILASKELPPTTTSLSTLGIPFVGILSSWIILHEHISWIMVIAMLFIFSGLLLVIAAHRKKG